MISISGPVQGYPFLVALGREASFAFLFEAALLFEEQGLQYAIVLVSPTGLGENADSGNISSQSMHDL